MENELLQTVIPVAEMLIIKRDVDLLVKMATTQPRIDPIFINQIMPYMAMVGYEAVNFMNKIGANIEIDQKSKFSMVDVRNKAKFFDLKFTQIMQCTSNVDELQHRYFAEDMKYPKLAKWNIHDNLGIYFNSEKKVIGNTQYQVWIFQDNNTLKKPIDLMDRFMIQSRDANEFGHDVGGLIGQVSGSLEAAKDFMLHDVDFRYFKYYANDFNTNRCKTAENENYKTIRLLLLHILSSVGFMLYGAKKCIVRENGFLLRIEYIALHYALKRLSEIKKFLERDDMINDVKLLECASRFCFDGNSVLNADFGKCMRHYGLRDKDEKPAVISDKFDLALPFCGLIESYYDTTYSEYQILVESELEKIYTSLHEYLQIEAMLSPSSDVLIK